MFNRKLSFVYLFDVFSVIAEFMQAVIRNSPANVKTVCGIRIGLGYGASLEIAELTLDIVVELLEETQPTELI